MKLRHLSVAAILAACASTAVYGAGYFPGWPIVGNPSYCGGSSIAGVPGTAAVCNNTVPAGPPVITGNELIPADTQLSQGQFPQTVYLPSGLLAPGASGANALTGGDFGLALWQRGTLSANLTPSTASNFADGWYQFSTGNTVSISKQTGASDVPSALSPTLASMRVNRITGSNVTPICVGQVLPQKESQRFLGNNAVFSGYMLAGSGFSPTANAVTMTIAYYTAADSTVAGTNTGTFASSIGATQNITGYTEVVNGTQNLTTTWTRYSVSGAIPLTNASGTAVTGVGVKICYTPTGTGGTTDWFELANAQFEPRGGTSTGPSAFNRRLPTEEWQLEYSRVWEITEGLASNAHAVGWATSSIGAEIYMQYPVEQRLATPTATYTAGFAATNAAGAAQNCTALSSGGTVGPLSTNIACTTSGLTSGNGSGFVDNGGHGVVQFSSEP